MRGRRRSEEGSSARIIRNSLVNGLGSFSGVLITLFLTPLLIDRLGVSGYGVWVLATSLTFSLGYLSFAELGIESSAVRFIAEARGSGEREHVNRVISTALGLFIALALVLTPILVLVAGPLSGVFSIPASLEDEARLTFMLVAAQLALDLPSRAFSAVVQGVQRYGVWQGVELTQISLTAGVFAAVVLSGGGIDDLALASVGIAGVMLLVNMAAARLVAPGIRVSPRLFSRDVVRQIGSYGSQLMLFRLGGLVYRQTDKTIIGVLLGSALVTTFEIAFKLQAAAAMVESMAVSALLPAVAFNRERLERLQDMFTRGTAYAMAVTMPFVVSAFMFAEPVIRTWIGEGFESSVTPTRIFLGVLLFSSLVSVGQSMLTGLGKLRKMLILGGVWIVLNLVLSLALAKPLGVEGVILGTLLSQAITALPLLRVMLDELDVPARTFARRVVLPVLPAIGVQASVSFPMVGLADGTDSLAVVALLAIPGMLAFALTYLYAGLDRDQRGQLFATFGAALGREAPPGEPAAPLREEVPGGDPPRPGGLP